MATLEEVRNYLKENYSKARIIEKEKVKGIQIGGGLANRGYSSNDIDLIIDIDEDILDEPDYSEDIIKIVRDIQSKFPEKIDLENESLKVDIQFFVLSGKNGVSQYGKVHDDNTISKSVNHSEISRKQKNTVSIF